MYEVTQFVHLKVVKEHSLPDKVRIMNSPEKVVKLCKDMLQYSDREKTACLYLSQSNEVNAIEVVSIGTLTASLVSPREIFKTALLSNSASIILVHNHPGGRLEPSEADIKVTRRIKEAGKLLDVELLDHVIMNDNLDFFSFKEGGYV